MKKTLLLSFITLCLYSCQSTKYYQGFKKEKKKIQNLAIIDPVVLIDESPLENPQKVDRLEKHLDSLIKHSTINLLEKRYSKITTKTANIDYSSLDSIINSIHNSSSSKTFRFTNTFKNLETLEQEKYAMMLVYKGSYNPVFKPHTQLNGALGGMYILSMGNKIEGESDLSLIVFNLKTKEIVLFDRNITTDYDPRVPSEIQRMTKLFLKTMYYK